MHSCRWNLKELTQYGWCSTVAAGATSSLIWSLPGWDIEFSFFPAKFSLPSAAQELRSVRNNILQLSCSHAWDSTQQIRFNFSDFTYFTDIYRWLLMVWRKYCNIPPAWLQSFHLGLSLRQRPILKQCYEFLSKRFDQWLYDPVICWGRFLIVCICHPL